MSQVNKPKKIRVAVLYGGRSGEHEVSLRSAASVIKHLDKTQFELVPVGIDKQGRWHVNDLKQIALDDSLVSLPIKTANSALFSASPNALMAATQREKAADEGFDVMFPVMHGTLCEDGALQGLLESADVAYVGAGVLGSAVGMDKDVSKRLIAAAGLAVPPFVVIKRGHWDSDQNYYLDLIEKQLSYPVFVKPANTGSSVGVHKVKKAGDLLTAVADAFLYDTKILIEKAVNIREIELSVLENPKYGLPPLVSVAGEIKPTHEFYSYEAKYLDENGAELLIPAPLKPEQLKRAQALASQIFELLDCEGMARVDLLLDKNTDEFYFNEINTLPGFTSISMYPKLWEASGISYSKLLTTLIELAIARHERKQKLKRDWAIAAG
jgi:D-alanine-D-alanine ligase